jgi:uncharacterized membrane protein
VVDIKVLLYSNFSKKLGKKMNLQASMRNGRFHPSKCGGKVQKMGVMYTHSSKMPNPSLNFLINPKNQNKNTKKIWKKWK